MDNITLPLSLVKRLLSAAEAAQDLTGWMNSKEITKAIYQDRALAIQKIKELMPE